MKTKHLSYINILCIKLLLLSLLTLSYSCTKKKNTIPSFQKEKITEITSQSAIFEGVINNPDEFQMGTYGVIWSLYHISDSAGGVQLDNLYNFEKTYKCVIKNLVPNTKYYVRAYVTDNWKYHWGEELSFTTKPSETTPFNLNKSYGSVQDINGNVYKTISIGEQVWMAENLRVTKFNNGNPIEQLIVDSLFHNYGNPAWCYYNDDSIQFNNPYGKLYNIYVVNNNKNICPTGWHIPTYNDYSIFKSNLPIENNGGVLKSTGFNFWNSPNTLATNETGFSAIGGGIRENSTYKDNKELSQYWVKDNFYMILSSLGTPPSSEIGISNDIFNMSNGFSIRCLKD